MAGVRTKCLSERRYSLVVLRALVARGRAQRRELAFFGEHPLLDFLFPAAAAPEPADDNTARDQSPPQTNKQVKRGGPRLPDDAFSVIARFYGRGALSAEEEAAATAEAVAIAAAEEGSTAPSTSE